MQHSLMYGRGMGWSRWKGMAITAGEDSTRDARHDVHFAVRKAAASDH